MKDWGWKNILVWVFLITVLFMVPAIMVKEGIRIKNSSQLANLPKIEIILEETELGNIEESSKDDKYLISDLKLTNGDETIKFSNIELKGRGNATWLQTKKPYQIKFQHKTDLLGLGKRRKWILLANYVDTTNLRTDTAFYLEKMLGEKFAYEGEFAELCINGNYEGLYYLTRGIEVGKNAVDLKDPLGVLVELDNAYAKNESQYYVTNNGEHLTVKDARTEEYIGIAMEDFLTDFNRLELAIEQQDFKTIERLIDVKSFAQYYLLEEFVVNVDAYFTSQYFHKDGPEDKIHAGPAWDFDITMNVWSGIAADFNYTETLRFSKKTEIKDQYGNRSGLFAKLIEIPEFRDEVNAVFGERLSGRKYELLNYIFKRAAQIYRSALRDSKKWNKTNYVQEIKRLLDWTNERYDYFEKTYGQDFKNS